MHDHRADMRLGQTLKRLDAVLVAADQPLYFDAGDISAIRQQPAAGHKCCGKTDQRDERDQQGADTPEGEFAPHTAAIDDSIGIERHGSRSFKMRQAFGTLMSQ
jgi:hypothetical protein